MFTGLIRSLGTVGSFTSGNLVINVDRGFLTGMKTGDSVAVNGTCLSITSMTESSFTVFVSEETKKLTTVSILGQGSTVNLETPMRLGDMLHGHLVQGHVDGIGMVEEFHRSGQGWILKVKYPKELDAYIVHKGSIAVNGISLTVAKKYSLVFEVAIIPETVDRTSLKTIRKNDKVNLETDMVAKYVESLLKTER